MTYVVRLVCAEEAADEILAELLDFETLGVEQEEQGGRVWLAVHVKDRAQAEALAVRFNVPVQEIPSENWAESWQQQWTPILAGERFYLSPPWKNEPTPPGRIRIEMLPGLVFGSGDHATTRMCIALLERYLKRGHTMADIGCGSGILGIIARELEASRVIACDLEWDAMEAVGATLPQALSWQGSIDALRDGSANVVAANLLTNIVIDMMPSFHRVLRAGGVLVTSGFLESQVASIAHHGFERIELLTESEWAAAAFRKLEK